MAREYRSYLLRCWWLPDGTQRVELEHIASGDRTQVDSLTAAIAWINQERTRPSHPAAMGTARRGVADSRRR